MNLTISILYSFEKKN